jgi:hypothetical protein
MTAHDFRVCSLLFAWATDFVNARNQATLG